MPTLVVKSVISVVAILETALLALFAVFSLSGDELGIARAMLIALALPFGVTTLPRLVLAAQGRLLWASALVALSVPLIWLVWFLA